MAKRAALFLVKGAAIVFAPVLLALFVEVQNELNEWAGRRLVEFGTRLNRKA